MEKQDGMIPQVLRFPEWRLPGVAVAFTLREPEPWPLMQQGAEVLSRQGFVVDRIVQVVQVHGTRVCVVDKAEDLQADTEADGLFTDRDAVTLVVRVADCAPLYIVDVRRGVVGLLHSGRKGTQAGILPKAFELMWQRYGSDAGDVTVCLGPCIRPPDYEVDLPALIRSQAEELGVRFYDCGENTAADAQRYYSYRMERGNTCRHFAAIRRCDL